jgi:hypothetical protein
MLKEGIGKVNDPTQLAYSHFFGDRGRGAMMVLQKLINLIAWVPLAKPEGLASARASFAWPVAPRYLILQNHYCAPIQDENTRRKRNGAGFDFSRAIS